MEYSPNTYNNTNKPLLPPWVEVLLLIITILFCLFLAQGLNFLWSKIYAFDYQQLTSLQAENSTVSQRNFTRLLALTSNALTFILPSLIFSIFMYRKVWLRRLGLFAPFQSTWFPMIIAFTLSVFFFSQFTFWLNKMLPLPEWATQIENQTNDLIEMMITMQSVPEFLFALFVAAVIPALGEELLFRGILQRRLIEMGRNPHLAIVITAIVFSFIHFQFEGFLPRMVLGLMLGYLYYWTKNLWAAIFSHFLINGIQVTAAFVYNDKIQEQLQNTDLANAPAKDMLLTAGISLIFIFFVAQWFITNSQNNTEVA